MAAAKSRDLSMVAPPMFAPPLEHETAPVPQCALATELEFYGAYRWCLNPHLTVREATAHLRDELAKLEGAPAGWQRSEIGINVWALACGILNCVDEWLRGRALRMPDRLAATRIGRCAKWVAEWANLSAWRRSHVRRWRERWIVAVNDFLSVVVAGHAVAPASLAASGGRLAMVLRSPLPADLQGERIGVPSAFRRLDLTHVDVLALGRLFVRRFPDRSQALLLIGLRTSGSYFAPLLRAFLETECYRTVSVLTIEPKKGPGRWEDRQLRRFAQRGYTALIVDDPPHTADALFVAYDIARRAGFGPGKLRAAVPTHPARRDWFKSLPDDLVVSLPPEQWHKRALLDPKVVEGRLAEYFGHRGFASIQVVTSGPVEKVNDHLQSTASGERATRLKRIFEVHLETHQRRKETRYVLAKSVGWGWLGYHAFLAGHGLSGFVPPILGLRDGILYMEWLPQSSLHAGSHVDRDEWINRSASYVAARVHRLTLRTDPVAGLDLHPHQSGIRLLEKALSRAYGSVLTDTLMRSRIGRLLRQHACPFPTLIDGNMHPAEWIVGPHGPLKADYEHHGMGKGAVNVSDPAYDLADMILNFGFSPEDESRLIRRYAQESGDVSVERRLFMNKLLAGLRAMEQAQEGLFDTPRDGGTQLELHRRFMNAWNFLTVQTARYCGSLYRAPDEPQWRSPLVALDIDGVLDRRLFGFPCSTVAGLQALFVLRTHDVPILLNTARSVAEVKDYCQAYSLAGGVAEHGSYVWDAIGQCGRVLISSEPLRQLAELRRSLQRIPGVFLDDRHRYSIRAFTYQDGARGMVSSLVKSMQSFSVGDGALAPLPTLLVHRLLVDLGLDRLSFHHTMIDTAIVATEVDKGTGLRALRDWVVGPDAETIAVGDHEADLAMFRTATRSFAVANIRCRRQARLVGCQIAHHRYQRGLLEIVQRIVHPGGDQCARCAVDAPFGPAADQLMEILRVADRTWITNLIRALFNPVGFRIFLR